MGFLDNLMGGLGTGIAAKVAGIPQFNKPKEPPRGTQAGQLQEKYYRGLYGNKLNPWEWQGGSGEGGVSAPIASGMEARNTLQKKQNVDMAMQSADLSNKVEVARIGANATMKAAGVSEGDKPIYGLPGAKAKQAETQVNINQKMVNKVKEETELTIQEAKRVAAEIKILAQELKIKTLDATYREYLIWSEIMGKGGSIAGGAILLKKGLSKPAISKIKSIGEWIKSKTKGKGRIPHKDAYPLSKPKKLLGKKDRY